MSSFMEVFILLNHVTITTFFKRVWTSTTCVWFIRAESFCYFTVCLQVVRRCFTFIALYICCSAINFDWLELCCLVICHNLLQPLPFHSFPVPLRISLILIADKPLILVHQRFSSFLAGSYTWLCHMRRDRLFLLWHLILIVHLLLVHHVITIFTKDTTLNFLLIDFQRVFFHANIKRLGMLFYLNKIDRIPNLWKTCISCSSEAWSDITSRVYALPLLLFNVMCDYIHWQLLFTTLDSSCSLFFIFNRLFLRCPLRIVSFMCQQRYLANHSFVWILEWLLFHNNMSFFCSFDITIKILNFLEIFYDSEPTDCYLPIDSTIVGRNFTLWTESSYWLQIVLVHLNCAFSFAEWSILEFSFKII